MKYFDKKYIGKIIIITISLAIAIFSNVYMFNIIGSEDIYKSGTVLAKDIGMTTGKYPKQYWIISFKYDDSVLGTKDINVTYSTYARLNPGDKTSFKVNNQEYERALHNYSAAYELRSTGIVLISFMIDFLILVLLLYLFGFLITKLWNGNY